MKKILALILLAITNSSSAIGASSDTVLNGPIFNHSSISIMYNVKDTSLLEKYGVDNVTWGQAKVRGNKSHYSFKINSSNIALIQEGSKYVICSSVSVINCNAAYRNYRNKNMNDRANSAPALKLAVRDLQGNIVGVPWLSRGDVVVPMASVNDPGYKSWLINKISEMLKTRPNAIHFDEPQMSIAALKYRVPFGLTQSSEMEFAHYLSTKKESGWNPGFALNPDNFNYSNLIKSDSLHSRKSVPPLWNEFVDFKLSSTAKLFGDLVAYIKSHASWPILISANASPVDWKKSYLFQHLDFFAPEINHQAKNLKVPNEPLYIYKMAEAWGKPVVSTAFGTDWAVIKKGQHVMLACSWIAQAYASGEYMNFPLKAWVPGSTYEPKSNIYPELSTWIKKNNELFDSYHTVGTNALVVNVDALRNKKYRDSISHFTTKLIKKGVLFKIILESSNTNIKVPAFNLNSYKMLIIPLPEYFSKTTISKIVDRRGLNTIWEPESADMHDGAIKPGLSQINIAGTAGIIAMPRVKGPTKDGAVVVHLLNRDYHPSGRSMEPKGPFSVNISKELFGNLKVTSAMLYQPVLSENKSNSGVNSSTKMQFKDHGDHLTITVPHLGLWGVVQFK